MELHPLFTRFWKQYTTQNPSPHRINTLIKSEGETLRTDHIAFRTFNDARVNIDVLSQFFKKSGYIEKGTYQFEEKKLFARHFEHQTDPEAPKVFISELILENFSEFLRKTILYCLDQVPGSLVGTSDLIYSGNVWGAPSFDIYNRLRNESEYAAWVYVYGYCPNHFAVFTNVLKKYSALQDLNTMLKSNGFLMNTSGGEIKGNPGMLLEQSSIMADIVPVQFQEGTIRIPACYYEFTRRYPDKNGKLYNGFIETSADKIFESTNFYTQE
jgi:hypothetical protein